MAISKSVTDGHTYNGQWSEINFSIDDQGALEVTIDTERLHIRSVRAMKSDYDAYAALYGDPDVMGKFATGETKTREYIENRIQNLWVKRWETRDPYSGLAVFKNDTDEFVGHGILGHGDEPGVSDMAGLSLKKYWHQGYAKEAAAAIVLEYAPATVKEGYQLDGKTLYKINATARPDNIASVKMLEALKMTKVREEPKFDGTRYHYSLLLA